MMADDEPRSAAMRSSVKRRLSVRVSNTACSSASRALYVASARMALRYCDSVVAVGQNDTLGSHTHTSGGYCSRPAAVCRSGSASRRAARAADLVRQLEGEARQRPHHAALIIRHVVEQRCGPEPRIVRHPAMAVHFAVDQRAR